MTRGDPNRGRGRSAPARAPEALIVDEPFDRNHLHALRATLAAHTSGLDIPEVAVEHLLIVASELATNAVRHGGGSGRLRLWRDRDGLRCQVTDGGPGFADTDAGTTPPDQSEVAGRGLWICRRLCVEVTVRNAAAPSSGATVTALLSLDGGDAVR
jgi:anti-sigma regulatory factor (Ser/Thr protein kinase)